MYGLRAVLPQQPHVVRTVWFPSLTLQVAPGMRGARQPSQNGRSFGMGTWVLALILVAISTYLRARSSLPSRTDP